LTREQWAVLEQGQPLTLEGEAIAKEDVLVSRAARGEVVLETSGDLTVALDTALDEALKREGLFREALRGVQQARQAATGLEVSHRIELHARTASLLLLEVLRGNEALLREEALIAGALVLVSEGASPSASEGWVGPHQVDVEGQPLVLHLRRV
jgi:isoleucyl-tRNA synthetase